MNYNISSRMCQPEQLGRGLDQPHDTAECHLYTDAKHQEGHHAIHDLAAVPAHALDELAGIEEAEIGYDQHQAQGQRDGQQLG